MMFSDTTFKRGSRMDSLLPLGIMVVLYLVLVKWVMPKLGIRG